MLNEASVLFSDIFPGGRGSGYGAVSIMTLGFAAAFLLGITFHFFLTYKAASTLRQIQEKLLISEERLRLATSGTSDGLWDWDIATGDVYYSPRFMSELGYEAYELPYTLATFSKLLCPEDEASTFRAIEKERLQLSTYDVEYRLRHKMGGYLWFHARGTTTRDKAGHPLRMTGFTTNIDQAKRTRDALLKSNLELRLIFDNVDARIWFKDDLNNILRLNTAAAHAMGGVVTDFEGKSVFDLFPSLAQKYFEDDLDVVRSGAPKLKIIEKFVPIGASEEWVSTDKLPYHDPISDRSGVIVFSTDITDRKKFEEQQTQLVESLSEANMELARFAYVASHDMQEPLRMISSFGAILATDHREGLNNEGREYLDIMTHAAVRMQKMIVDLLEFARVGSDSSNFVAIDTTDEIKHVLENLFAAMKTSNAVVTHGDLPKVKGNPVQFTRLLQNLIENGLKYQKGGTAPQVHVTAAKAGNVVTFSVTDNGIGMEARYVTEIFEPFKRLHSAEEYRGTGIGLAVCKKIVETHGGTIWATSTLGTGSQFHFTMTAA